MTEPNLYHSFMRYGKCTGCPVYDMHGHMGPMPGEQLPNSDPDSMLRSMDRAGVQMLVFCSHQTLFNPLSGNSPNIEVVRQHPQRFRAYCGLNPNYPEEIDCALQNYDDFRDVYVGFKFLADYHRKPITCAEYEPAWQFADDNELLILLHTWDTSPLDGPEPIAVVAEKYPNVQILMGHSCHGNWRAAVELTKCFPNLYLELTAVLDERGVLEFFVEQVGSERLLYGTDLPWFSEHYYIGAVLGAEITDEDRRNIFYRNAQRLIQPFLA